MKLSLEWINEFVNIDGINPADLMNRLTMSTAEVEGLETVGEHFRQVLAVRVIEVKQHPNADKLKIVKVADGVSEYEVVCGAPNVAVGQMVALARTGTVLPSGELKPAVIRGVKSEGMLCAEDELGISDDHSGLLLLPEGTAAGTTLDAIYGAPDALIEIDNKSITNRPDLWGHYGFAREVAAIYGRSLKFAPGENVILEGEAVESLQIENRAPELCMRYSALVIDNVSVRPSPEWMQRRLRRVGLRPINNLVDVTNYIMLELGQPMHAFDRRMIEGGRIIIRRAESGEKFVTLDGVEHELSPENLLIADAVKGVALAGVMGGLHSSIAEDTGKIVLESATFHAANVRRTANAFALRTDSAQRFEKSQDPCNTVPALYRAFELIRLTCPQARTVSPVMDSWPVKAPEIKIEKSLSRIRRRLGADIPDERILGILASLKFGIEKLDDDRFVVSVPSWRATKDISMGADIVEEVGRIYGYDNIAPQAPLVACVTPPSNPQRIFERRLKNVLCTGLGFDEVMNYSMSGEQLFSRCGFDSENALRLRNHLSVEEDRMRTSLIPQIIMNVADNQRFRSDFRIFENGRSYHKVNRSDAGLAAERNWVTGAVSSEKRDGLFLGVRSLLDSLLDRLGIEADWRVWAGCSSWAHPGRAAQIGAENRVIGNIAELHPKIAGEMDVRHACVIFELDADVLFELHNPDAKFTPLRRFPVNSLELTVVAASRRNQTDIVNIIRKSGGDLLLNVAYMYQYEGDPIPSGSKAVTYNIVFGADDHTLSSEEIEHAREGVIAALAAEGLPVRGR